MNLKSGYYLLNKCVVLQEELQSVANAAPASFTAAVNKRTTLCVCVCVNMCVLICVCSTLSTVVVKVHRSST